MRTRLLRSCGIAAFASAIALAAPATAADYYVPPSNSAATQYTESFPSAKGDRNAEREAEPRGHSAERALGERTARQLEAAGSSGEAVAEVVVETAPVTEPANAPSEAPGQDERARGGTGSAGSGSSESSRDDEDQGTAAAVGGSDGDSGAGAVLAGAFGASAGGGGLLLPPAIVAIAIWALAYARSRRPDASR